MMLREPDKPLNDCLCLNFLVKMSAVACSFWASIMLRTVSPLD